MSDSIIATLLRGFALAATIVAGIGFSTSGLSAPERRYVLATAAEGGTFFPAGNVLATLVTAKLKAAHGIALTTTSSAGSEENARLLRQNQAQFAFMSALIGFLSRTGRAPYEADGPDTGLRAVAAVWPDVEHFVVTRKHAQTGTIEDLRGLKGQRVSFGLEGTGTLTSSRFLLGNLGMDVDRDFDLVFYSSFTGATRALFHGQIGALSLEAGVPASAITLATNVLGNEAVILEFTDAQLQQADGGLGLWTRHVIRTGTYPALDQDVDTIATPTILAVRADVDEDAVYRITKAIFENLQFLRLIHEAFSETSLDAALISLPVPLHPGAARYYREVGIAD